MLPEDTQTLLRYSPIEVIATKRIYDCYH